jgi:GT2 family glycosyltransferase
MELNKSLFRSPTFLKSPLNKIGEPTTFMFRKSIVEKIGYFREDLMQILDYEFCYRVLKRYHIVILNETLCKFRLHEHQATQLNKGQDQNDYRIYRQIIHKHYFWYLSRKEQVLILREKYKLVAVLHRLWLKVNPR